jgi:hypothetical protein
VTYLGEGRDLKDGRRWPPNKELAAASIEDAADLLCNVSRKLRCHKHDLEFRREGYPVEINVARVAGQGLKALDDASKRLAGRCKLREIDFEEQCCHGVTNEVFLNFLEEKN